uniref:RNA-directed RNA polymerase n=1 Tax=Riboviria sp. TaxID=2585031 RepID=A0A8K1U2K3_9VIRU|nr:MAG: hypothetical protein 1 [Riboviria sp.]
MLEPSPDEFVATVGSTYAANKVSFRRPIIPGEEGFDDYYRYVLQSLEKTSSVGLGDFSGYTTIGDALGWDGLRFTNARNLALLKSIVCERIQGLARSVDEGAVVDWLERESCDTVPHSDDQPGLCDPIKMFVKPEPHSRKKLAEERFRLIHVFSLADQVIDRILFLPWQAVEVRNPMNTTQKGGWYPFPGAGAAILREIFPLKGSLAIDKSQWDWTMPGWIVNAYVRLKQIQMRDGSNPLYWRMVWGRISRVVGPNTIISMPTGLHYRQVDWGFMKSGWILTLSLNSAAQMLQHCLASIRLNWRIELLWAMGDDMLLRANWDDEQVIRYVAELERTGCKVKCWTREREFAGFRYEAYAVEPLYEDKHRFQLAYATPKDFNETCIAYQLLYAQSTNPLRDEVAEASIDIRVEANMWARGLISLGALRDVPYWSYY